MNSAESSQFEVPAAADPSGRPIPSRRILLVEDDYSIRQLSAGKLMDSGYEVVTAFDGDAGWEALQAGHFDLVITDNFMPKVTGFELVKLLREHDITIPVIMTTAAIPTAEMQRHSSLHIDAILVKPYTCEELLVAANEILHSSNGVPDTSARASNQPG